MGLTVAADFNGDGWQDIVVMDADGNPALYTNNGGDGSFTLDANSGLSKQRGGTMAVGDFNKDGYPDLLVNGWSDSTQGDGITINKNLGNGKFIPVTSSNFVGAEKGQAMFVDRLQQPHPHVPQHLRRGIHHIGGHPVGLLETRMHGGTPQSIQPIAAGTACAVVPRNHT